MCDNNKPKNDRIANKNIKTEKDELMEELLQEYFPKPEEADRIEIFALIDLEKIKCEEKRCNSLRNPKLYKGWREFVKNLPESNEEVVLTPVDKYWRWKYYKKYVPEERTYFRKTMANAPGTDKFGILPMTAEDARLYRTPHKQYQRTVLHRKVKDNCDSRC